MLNHQVQTSFLNTQATVPIAPVRGKIDTSQAAAESIAAVSGDLRKRVYDLIATCDQFGATADEIQHSLGLPAQTVTPRCNELLRLNLIVRSGLKRRTESGRSTHVYVTAAAKTKGVAQ